MVYLFTLYMKTDNIEYRMQLFTNRHFRPKRVDTSPIEREPNA
jgi:hypothetical protein